MPRISAPVHVVYIGGTGRSGSTLLARILGQIDGVVSPGEIRHLLRYGYLSLPGDVRCGCGEVFARCPFWIAVRAELCRLVPGVEIDGIPELLARVERIRYLPAIYSPWRTSRFTARFVEVTGLLAALYRAMLQVTGARVVVDESKDLSLLYILARMPEVKLDILHLVRDGRAVANSWTRWRRRPEHIGDERYLSRYRPIRSAPMWWYRNLGVEAVRFVASGYQRLRYEDLVDEPRERLRPLLEALELDPELPHLDGSSLQLLQQDHLATGNPARFQRGAIEIRSDLRWHSEMSPADKSLVTMLTWPLLLRYGYRVSAR